MNVLVYELHQLLGCEVAAKVTCLVSPSETMGCVGMEMKFTKGPPYIDVRVPPASHLSFFFN
jgi:hypothetical protein